MNIGNIDDFLLSVSFERKLKHWKKMSNSGYLPRRRGYIKSFGRRIPTQILKKGY